jgi:transposase-like protein
VLVYLYRAIDQYGQVIDVLVAEKRDLAATYRFFTRTLEHGTHPSEVTTERAATYRHVLDETAARHLPHHRAIRHGPHRSRSRTPESPATAHVRS